MQLLIILVKKLIQFSMSGLELRVGTKTYRYHWNRVPVPMDSGTDPSLRLFIVHAGGEEGLFTNAVAMRKAATNRGDCHKKY